MKIHANTKQYKIGDTFIITSDSWKKLYTITNINTTNPKNHIVYRRSDGMNDSCSIETFNGYIKTKLIKFK